MTAIRVRLGGNDHEVGENAVRNKCFRSIQQVVIALVFGLGANSGHVAAGARFGHCDCQNVLSRHTFRQPARFLLFCAEIADIRTDQSTVQKNEEPNITVLGIFLEQYLLITKICDTSSAVFLVGPHAQHALLACFQESFAINDFLFGPAFGVRTDFVLQKTS